MKEYSLQSWRTTSSLAFLGMMVVALLVPLNGCVSTTQWTVVEITQWSGIKIHDHGDSYYIVGGDTRKTSVSWAQPETPSMLWIMDAHSVATTATRKTNDPIWPRVTSADISCDGKVALARRIRNGSYYVGLTEICELRTGEIIARLDNHPLAVAWSHDGTTLAILEIGDDGKEGDPVFLSLWRNGAERMARWKVEFNPYAQLYSSTKDNTFHVSWNVDNFSLVVSTRSVPLNGMSPHCVIVNVADGPLCSHNASDAHFVGKDLIIANEDGAWNKVWLMRVIGDRLQKTKRVADHMFIAASDPASGTYVAWHPPPPFEFLSYSLPLGYHDLSGSMPVLRRGFGIDSTIRVMQSDILRGLLRGNSQLSAIASADNDRTK